MPQRTLLVPPWDETAQAQARAQLDQMVTEAGQQYQTTLTTLEQYAARLAQTLALQTARVFSPLRSDHDLEQTPAYQALMCRPQRDAKMVEEASQAWRAALRTLEQARKALAVHDLDIERLRRQHQYLATSEGQALQREWNLVEEALAAAKIRDHPAMIQVLESDREQLRQRFLTAVH